MGDSQVSIESIESGERTVEFEKEDGALDGEQDEIFCDEIRQDVSDSYAELDYDEENQDFNDVKSMETERVDISLENVSADTLESCSNKEPRSEASDAESAEDGEIDDLEEGELKSDGESEKNFITKRENTNLSVRKRSFEVEQVGICKFYLANKCTWGPDCKYIHPNERNSPKESAWLFSECKQQGRERGNAHSKVAYPSERKGRKESEWEKGLRQAKELMMKQKLGEEVDFDRKRHNVSPAPTDEDSDDSRHNPKIKRCRRSYSPVDRMGMSRESQRLGDSSQFRMKSPRSPPPARRRDWTPRGGDDVANRHIDYFLDDGDNFSEASRYRDVNYVNRHNTARPQRIPSLIDGLREGRFIPPPKNVDLGPQVLYPNGRPANAYRKSERPVRRGRYGSPGDRDRYYVPRTQSRSPRSRRSPSFSPQRSSPPSSEIRRRVHSREEDSLTRSPIMRRRKTLGGKVGAMSSGGEHAKDPWDRSRGKRGRSNDPTSVTLGSVLKKAKKRAPRRDRKSDTCSSRSSVSGNTSPAISSRTSSRSRSMSSSENVHQSRVPQRVLRQVSAVPGNPFDEDGSLRPTDLSSFKIPKKKRAGSPVHESRDGKHKIYNRKSDFQKKMVSDQKSFDRKETKKRYEKNGQSAISDAQAISSDNSSDSESSSSESAEPAAYRRRRKSALDDDGLPTEGIPLSPEIDHEPETAAPPMDVSSDEDDYYSEQNLDCPSKNSYASVEVEKISKSSLRQRDADDSDRVAQDRNELGDDEDDSDTESRAVLLQRLKYVEEAIARKRARPVD